MADFTLKDLKELIPTYDGEQATLYDFIEAVNFAFENVQDEHRNALLFVVKSKLTSSARRFISSRQLNNWEDIRQLLIGHYGDCRDTEGLLRDLTSCYQKPNELPRNFVQRIEDLLTKIRSSVALNNDLNIGARNALNASHEKIALKTFLAGLSEPLGSVLRSQKPNSLEQAEQFLIEEENITYLKNFKLSKPPPIKSMNNKIVPKENYQSSSSTTNFRMCSYCKKTGHTIGSCYKRPQNQLNQPGPSGMQFNANRRIENNLPNPANAQNQRNRNNLPQRPSVIQYAGRNNATNHHLNCKRDTENTGKPESLNFEPEISETQEELFATTEF
ncbi:hypothetical protein Zmor_000728 [Zophobas morio]|uniref:Retrotransposon gag domain-containing protein n=1 Tax=Zophobas morio TaxID=2755281 RepID=A0AA38IWX6_9CUCU|nr:hypothetical protein Zmor_000728 [Zophobas morio]